MPSVIPIAALFGEETEPNLSCDPRPKLAAAEIIMGVDVMSGREFLLYGREALQAFVDSGTPEQAFSTLRIGLDQETDELEKICALVEVVKGCCDYQADEVN